MGAGAPRMRILLVHDYGTLNGGAEHVTVALRDGLRRRGHDARLFASRAKPLPLPNVADYTCFGTMAPSRRVLQTVNLSAAIRLRRTLREFRPDVVHLRMFLTQLSPVILRWLRDHATLLHVGSYELVCPLLTKILPDGSACGHEAGLACYRAGCVSLGGLVRTLAQRGLLRRWRESLRLIVTNSEWARRRLAAEGIDANVVRNGVPVRPPRPPLATPPTVAFAGRLVAKKGADVLVDAMTRVVAQHASARLILAGDGPERGALAERIVARGLADRVTVLGHRPREALEQLLAAAWVQVVPSRWEDPSPNVAAEAMMRGTAVIGSRSGGLTELVRDGTTGFLVPPGDAGALAGSLLRVLGDRDLAERLGAAGRAVALAELTEDAAVERFLGLYATLQSKRIPA
jgi:glycosyltransferase involved in cell wall biosynthesis